ncbi:hypothetical protein E1281_11800 [Actinomadura sp. KC345]|uniref:hypothetical protein n=1 Tax=Actinomadura sp. KC345 TaxID=2530371 RepID=UPI001052BD9B|nr:hypothetical protein [Actinomadura sp. KC345]TDC55542.1 hypothetical protein E1281_11800 [Actinomadura sp. KC345]
MALAGVLCGVGLLAWTCTGDADEPVQNAGAVASTSPPPPPTVMPTVTVTTTATPEPEEAEDGGPCEERDLVFGMSTEKTYSGSSRPEFRITVVNTGSGSCAFSTESLDVRITSGSDRIWSSAECRDGDSPKKDLRRGIPYVETVTWDRMRGCDGKNTARPGTYVADLKDKKTKKQIFHLR